MIALTGSIFDINIAIVLPPFLELLLAWSDKQLGRCKWKLIKNVFLSICGVFACFAGTYLTSKQIIDVSSGSEKHFIINSTFLGNDTFLKNSTAFVNYSFVENSLTFVTNSFVESSSAFYNKSC